MAAKPFTADFVAFGENPNGVSVVTPNGVSHESGRGQNHQWNYGPGINGPRWEMPPEEDTIICGAPVTGAIATGAPVSKTPRQPRNRNRSGE